MQTKSLDQHIEITPGVAGGKPHIAGHRITVQNIAAWHERLGQSAREITAEYDLTLAEFMPAWRTTSTTARKSTEALPRNEAFVQDLQQRTPSRLKEKLVADKSGSPG